MSMQQRFVTFEGGEGAGKSTQIQRLRQRLEGEGLAVVETREPGGSPKAEEIRDILLSGMAKKLGPFGEALLFSAARLDHIKETIAPALKRGAFVLCDRFSDSTRAYQGVVGNVDPELILLLERIVVGDMRPRLTLILDLPEDIGLARALKRRRALGEAVDRFEAEGVEFHRKLRLAFLDIAAAEPERCIVVNAAQEVDQVERAIWHAVKERILLGDRSLGA